MQLSIILLTALRIPVTLSRPTESRESTLTSRRHQNHPPFAFEHHTYIDSIESSATEGEEKEVWARSDGHVEARIVDSERTALEPELGALDRGELMEDGVRIWWSSGNSGENFKIHLVGSLVLKEGPYAMSLTHDFWVYREQREKFCTLYYQRLTHEWLQRRRRISLDGLDFWCGFDFENEKFLIDRDRVGEPFRNYIGMRLTTKPEARVDGEALAIAVTDYFREVRPDFDHRMEKVADADLHHYLIRGPQRAAPRRMFPPLSNHAGTPPFTLKGFRAWVSFWPTRGNFRVHLLGGLRVKDPAVVSALAIKWRGSYFAAAFFEHFVQYCGIFRRQDRYSGRWAPLFSDLSYKDTPAWQKPEIREEYIGAVGAFFERRFEDNGNIVDRSGEYVKMMEEYFRSIKMPFTVEWVTDAFKHDGVVPPPFGPDPDELPQSPREPETVSKVKVGGKPGGERGDKSGRKGPDVDMARIFEAYEVLIEEMKPL